MKRRSYHFFQSIYFKIPLLILFILMIAFQFIGVYFIDQLESQSVSDFKAQINTQTSFLTSNLLPIMIDESLSNSEEQQRLSQTLDTFSSTIPTRIWVLNQDETVIASDQDLERDQVGTQANSQAVRNVILTQSTYAAEIIDAETQEPLYQLIMPIMTTTGEANLMGVVVVEANMSQIYTQTQDIVWLFMQSAFLAIVIALVIAFVLSQGLTRPLENMRQQAIRIAEGVYSYPAKVYGQDELGELALTINELADKVRTAQETTESERQRLDGVLRHMRDGVIGTDRRGNIVLVNDRALYLLNLRQSQVIGRSILNLLGVEEEYTLKDLMNQDTEVMLTLENNGVTTILRSEFSVVLRETGFVTGLVCVLTDITEQEKTEQERRDFVSNVSHELRTPLTSVKSYSDALLDGALQDEEVAQQFVSVIQSESNRMIRMVSNLLELSKIDGGQIMLSCDLIDFKRLVNHIIDRVVFTLDDTENYNIVRKFTSREIFVDIDQDRMTQVIDNLLNNAIKYSPDGGQITITIAEEHDKVILSIEDQGLGISQVNLQHLFERFYRVDKARSRQQGGSGLGLAISKEVVELHGGRIWVESIEGEGSIFSFSLPYTNIEEVEADWGDFDET